MKRLAIILSTTILLSVGSIVIQPKTNTSITKVTSTKIAVSDPDPWGPMVVNL